MKPIFLLCLLLALFTPVRAQQAAFGKLSPTLRQWVRQSEASSSEPLGTRSTAVSRNREVISFLKTEGDAGALVAPYGGKCLAQEGDIAIISIPLGNVAALSLHPLVKCMEAEPSRNTILMDSTALHVDATPVYEGLSLQQAYTGKGVLVGVQDIGFDLTHPNFYDASGENYRIVALWDQLSTDTVGSSYEVGRDYRGTDALLVLGCSRDGCDQTHGTHTTGIAAGSGGTSRYRGMAWESDICLVANATSEDIGLIDSADYYKYTYATDALGFKYIFDTADSLGMPCVINFSEGSSQDFRGWDQLYYEMLEKLVGAGHIIVSSAGNQGEVSSYIHKAQDSEGTGTFIYTLSNYSAVTLNADGPFTLRCVLYGSASNDTLLVSTQAVLSQSDSIYTDSLLVDGRQLQCTVSAYPNCYNSEEETVYDVEFESEEPLYKWGSLSVEALGQGSTVDFYRMSGVWTTNSHNPSLTTGECTHNIHSPSSCASVICVGATSYRTSFTNYKGEQKVYNKGTNGMRGAYSSVGPTFDGRIKPDVLAPGTNIISSYSSYYLENHPDAGDISSDVEHFEWNGRTYAWNANSGTSMASPVVTGAIALWLQAKPTLTPEEVLETIAATSTHYDDSLTYNNNYYGYGQIDVYKGLLHILGIDKVESISTQRASHFSILPTAEGVRLQASEPTSSAVRVSVYSTDGKRLLSKNLPAGRSTYEVAFAGHGVFVVQVAGDGSELIRK
jgi:subtilisin family serine protease